MACPKLPVELQFSSSSSVAFNARLEFFDTDGNSFALPVAGSAENCLFTNYHFLQTHGLAAELEDELNDTSESLETGSTVVKSTKEHRGSTSNTSLESDGKRTRGYQFYTHATGRFPVYLLSTRQVQAEFDKLKESQLTPVQHVTTNGFVTVDPSTGLEDEAPSSSSLTLFTEGEIQFVLQYLNANFLRTPVTRFPEDFADTAGRPLYELLDMICLKKPGGLSVPSFRGSNGTNKRKTGDATSTPNGKASGPSTTSNASASVAQPSKKDQLTQYTAQYVELLKFLRAFGAMVHDVFPEHLLAQEFYVRACENPQADPALLSSPSYATLPFVARRRVFQTEWLAASTEAWMKVTYQVIKCFLLSRITWKGYQMQQLQDDKENGSGEMTSARNDKRKGDKLTSGRACQGSNVYSEAEMVLIQWLCDRVGSLHKPQHPVTTTLVTLLETQLVDLSRDLRDGRWLFHLVAARIPTLSVD